MHQSQLHPRSELSHPIIAKATESFGPGPSADESRGSIGWLLQREGLHRSGWPF